VEESIKAEVNGKKNPKQITKLKKSRVEILSKYSKIINKLNQVK
jgi:hypothetical protein